MSGSIGDVTSISTKPLKPINHTNAPTTKVDTIVPKTAKRPMVQKLAKKSRFFSEYPASNCCRIPEETRIEKDKRWERVMKVLTERFQSR